MTKYRSWVLATHGVRSPADRRLHLPTKVASSSIMAAPTAKARVRGELRYTAGLWWTVARKDRREGTLQTRAGPGALQRRTREEAAAMKLDMRR